MAGMMTTTNGKQRGATERPSVAMTQAESKVLTPQKKVEILFQQAMPKLVRVVPTHVSIERLLRLALVAMARDPKLAQATPESILMAVMQLAALGLEPNTALQQAFLVPFSNRKKIDGRWQSVMEASPIIGARGFILLAEQADIVTGIRTAVVYERDHYKPVREGGSFLHEPFTKGDPGPWSDVYCRWINSRGEREYECMTRHQVLAHRARWAKKFTEDDGAEKFIGPWGGSEDEIAAMGAKTTVRRAAKVWPMSSERATKLRDALALDEAAEGGKGDHRIGMPGQMLDALGEISQLRDSMEAEAGDDDGATPALPERREDLIRMAVETAHERQMSLPRAPGEMSDAELRAFIGERG